MKVLLLFFFLLLLSLACAAGTASEDDGDDVTEAQLMGTVEDDVRGIKQIPRHVAVHGKRYWAKQDNRQLKYGRRIRSWDEEMAENLKEEEEEEEEEADKQ